MEITNCENHYPVIKFNEQFLPYLNGKIPELEQPNPPEKPKILVIKPIWESIFFYISVVAILIAFIGKGWVTFWAIFIGFICIYLCVTEHKNSIVYITETNKKNQSKYEQEQKEYNRKINEIRELRNKLSTEDDKMLFIKRRMAKISQKATKPTTIYQKSKKGASESMFVELVKDVFGIENISTGKTVPFESKVYNNYNYYRNDFYLDENEINTKEQKHFIPDIVFDNNIIRIDIEIDEPYAFDEWKIPIHYFDESKHSHKDADRDSYFVQHKWFVVRFAEIQIVKNPLGCCKVIAKLISEITSNNSFLYELETYSSPEIIKFWTYFNAEKLAEENYRDSYLIFLKNGNDKDFVYFKEKRVQIEKLKESLKTFNHNNSKSREDMKDVLTKYISIYPFETFLLKERGSIGLGLPSSGNIGAVSDLTQVIESNINDHESYFRRSMVYFLMKQYSKSIADSSECIEIKSDYWGAYYLRSFCYFELKNTDGLLIHQDKIMDDLTKTIELNPKYYDAYYRRAIARTFNDENDKNKKNHYLDWEKRNEREKLSYLDLCEFVEHGTNLYLTDAYYKKAQYERCHDKKQALVSINEVIERSPKYADAYYLRGDMITSTDRIKAIADYSKAIEYNTDKFEYYQSRGISKGYIGDKIGAIQDFDAAIKLAPKERDLYYFRGCSKKSIGQIESAIEDYDISIQIDKYYSGAYYKRAEAKILIDDKLGALQDYQKSLELRNAYLESEIKQKIKELQTELFSL